MKIGLLGGSFNPIHNSHVRIIKTLLKKSLVDEVRLIPCKKHAFDKSLASAKDRIAMIRLAIKNIPDVKICRIELKSRGKNYTINTIRKLKRKYKKFRFFLVIGSDILHEIKKWHNYKQLLNKIEFIVLKRKRYKIKNINGMRIKAVININNSISSTEIRNRMKEGKSIKNLVPKNVEKFIKKKRVV